VILLDVGVWLAAAWGRHVRHPAVAEWFDRQDGGLVMCRIAQMSLLRLLSNPAVLGEDVIARSEAWRVADAFLADPRVTWSDEPAGLEQAWRAFSGRDDRSHKPWTDDYLAAFAQAGGMTLATTDRGIASRYPSVQVETLS